MFKYNNVLITGGNGFIGSHLIKRLIDQGKNPVAILRPGSNRSRLQGLENKITIYEANIADDKTLQKIFDKVRPELVFHLASFGVYSYTDHSPGIVSAVIETNIKGLLNVIYTAHSSDTKLLINTGTCFEYGSKVTPFDEDEKLSPLNPYGVSKMTGTFLAQMLSKTIRLPIVTLRPFTVYGPYEDERRFISTITKQCLSGKNLTLTKETIIRDYVFIDDVVDAYMCTAERGEDLSGEAINIATGIGNDLESVARKIISLTRTKDIKIDKGAFPSRPGEVPILIGSPKKAQKLLNWKAKYTLLQGLKKTINWIQSQK